MIPDSKIDREYEAYAKESLHAARAEKNIVLAEQDAQLEALRNRVTELEALCNDMEAQALGLAADLKDTNDRAETAEARVAELEKALEPFARNVELIHPGAQDHDRLCDYGSQFNGTPTVGQARAARRVREGGKVDVL